MRQLKYSLPMIKKIMLHVVKCLILGRTADSRICAHAPTVPHVVAVVVQAVVARIGREKNVERGTRL